MKKIFLAVLGSSLLTLSSHAQTTPQADVALGYSYLHLNGSNSVSGTNTNGFSASLAYNFTGLIGVVADVGVYHGSVSGAAVTAESYMFGPRLSVRSSDKFTPFVQALLGGGHVNSVTVGNTTVYPGLDAFAFSFGGGADIGIAKNGRLALRPEFDYVGLNNSFSTVNSQRVSISLVFHLGARDRGVSAPKRDAH